MRHTLTLLPPVAPRRELQRFESIREQVETGAQGQWDTVVRRQDIALRDGRVTFALDTLGEHEESLSPTTWATAQLCIRLGIPVSYFRKCPTALQDTQANFWLRNGQASRNGNGHESEEEWETKSFDGVHADEVQAPSQPPLVNEQWLLRARHGELRAVLSERYSPLDNDELMATLAPLLPNRYRVEWFALGEESLHLRVIDPTRLREVLPDDPLSVGVHVANSEVGKRSVSVDALVYRLVCSNGLIRLVKGKSLLKRRHVHLSRPRFRAALEEALHGALSTADEFLDQLERTTQERVPDVEETLEKLGERWHLSQSTQDAVKAALQREPAPLQDTLYGLVNGFTQVAQTLTDDDRYDLEVLAGNLASHGLPAFARSKREKSIAVASLPESDVATAVTDEPVAGDPHDDEVSILDLAREMFDAEVVSRRRHPVGAEHKAESVEVAA